MDERKSDKDEDLGRTDEEMIGQDVGEDEELDELEELDEAEEAEEGGMEE